MRAFISPGQGSQSIGMGKALADASSAARDVFAEVGEAPKPTGVCFPVSANCFGQRSTYGASAVPTTCRLIAAHSSWVGVRPPSGISARRGTDLSRTWCPRFL